MSISESFKFDKFLLKIWCCFASLWKEFKCKILDKYVLLPYGEILLSFKKNILSTFIDTLGPYLSFEPSLCTQIHYKYFWMSLTNWTKYLLWPHGMPWIEIENDFFVFFRFGIYSFIDFPTYIVIVSNIFTLDWAVK